MTAPSKTRGATAILHYGTGFGSLVLIESQGVSSQTFGLQRQIAGLPHGLITATTIATVPGYELQTPLVTIAAWQHGRTTAIAAGLVPQRVFSQFLAAIR